MKEVHTTKYLYSNFYDVLKYLTEHGGVVEFENRKTNIKFQIRVIEENKKKSLQVKNTTK